MTHKALILMGAVCALGLASCCGNSRNEQAATRTDGATDVRLKDYGTEPTVLNIEQYTLANDNFRTAIWTGNTLQLTVMSIPVGGEVGLEQHHNIDQFLRIEQGTAEVMMGDAADRLDFVRTAADDDAIFVPAGKWHNIVNKGDKPLKIYSIYAPAEHPHGTVHKTYEEALEAEAHHHH